MKLVFNPFTCKFDWVESGTAGPVGPPGIDGEDSENTWPIPGPSGVSIQGSPGICIPGRDGEDAEDNNLSMRMGAHGSFADDDHTQYLLADGTREASEIRLTPKASSSGPEGTIFYDSDDDYVYVGTE